MSYQKKVGKQQDAYTGEAPSLHLCFIVNAGSIFYKLMVEIETDESKSE